MHRQPSPGGRGRRGYAVAVHARRGMLVVLGFAMVLTFMALIMTQAPDPMVALILVPTVFGLFAGAGLGLGDMVIDAIGTMAPTAALLMFAIMYFGIMIDVGLFDPLIRFITRLLGDDPAKVVLGTALLAGAVSLDGDGSTTFIITTSAMLPIYLRLGMSPVVLTCVAGLMNGTLNIVPWGGPTVRAATALRTAADRHLRADAALARRRPRRRRSPSPGSSASASASASARLDRHLAARRAAASRASAAAAVFRGARRPKPRRRARRCAPATSSTVAGGRAAGRRRRPRRGRADTAMADTMLDPNRATLRPKLIWFNLALTARGHGAARARHLPAAVRLHGRRRRRPHRELPEAARARPTRSSPTPRASSASSRWCSPPACSSACSTAPAWSTRWPTGSRRHPRRRSGPFLAVITGVLSIPFTFFMSNDAFYFGILPVLAESAATLRHRRRSRWRAPRSPASRCTCRARSSRRSCCSSRSRA